MDKSIDYEAVERLADYAEKQPPRDLELARMLIEIFGIDVWDDSAVDTARRVLRYWKEFRSHRWEQPAITTFQCDSKAMVLVKDIEFVSMCAHHLLPFYGRAHVAYLPDGYAIGLSKIPRIVKYLARRPRMQEHFTSDIVHYLEEVLDTKGVAAVVEGRHTCLACRGAHDVGAYMVTSELTGLFLAEDRVRAEFYAMLNRQGV